jgi:hypothetical protein
MQGIEVFLYIEVANMWLELLNKIKYAIEKAGFDGRVKLGFLSPQNSGVDSLGMVMLGRGEAMPADENVHNMLKQEFYIECWTKSDSHEFDVAYEQIAALESKIEKILIEFREQCGALNGEYCVLQESGYQIIDIRCTNKTDDHDSMRPFIGTQYRFEAKMYDLKENLNTKGGIY